VTGDPGALPQALSEARLGAESVNSFCSQGPSLFEPASQFVAKKPLIFAVGGKPTLLLLMASEVSVIEPEALQARVRELRRFL
jgi:hypothetical protein